MIKSIIDITMSRRIPSLLTIIRRNRHRQQRILIDPRETALIEGDNADTVLTVLLDDLAGFGVGVEGVHQDERDIDLVGFVEELHLADGEVEEGHAVTDFNGALGPDTSHSGAETTI